MHILICVYLYEHARILIHIYVYSHTHIRVFLYPYYAHVLVNVYLSGTVVTSSYRDRDKLQPDGSQ